MSIRYNEDLDPNEGPGFGCFVSQAILFAGHPAASSRSASSPSAGRSGCWSPLLFIDMVLLFFVSMTSVFLLRVFFADRARRGRGRQTGVAKAPTRVIRTDDEHDARREDE